MIDMIGATLHRFRIDEPDNFINKFNQHLNPIDTLSPYQTYKQPPFGQYRYYWLDHSKVQTYNGYVPTIIVRINPNHRLPYWLTIHWSPNKSVYGHNFYELIQSQFQEMITSTVELLRDCGVTINPLDLQQCSHLSRLDYGCNIPVTQLTTNEIINYLKYFEKNSRYSKEEELYHKEFVGSRLNFFNKSQCLTFYNKVAHILRVLERPEEASSDLYKFALTLRDYLRHTQLEVLRIEHRLQNQTAIKRELEPLIGHNYPFTIQEVFQHSVRTAVLRKHIDQVLGRGSLTTFVLGEQDISSIKNILLDARLTLGLREVNPVWDGYATTFRELGEKLAMQSVIDALPKSTGERGLKRWQRLMRVTKLNHHLLEVHRDINSYLSNPTNLNLP